MSKHHSTSLILFVDFGNSTRSPAAEAIFNHLTSTSPYYKAESAGTNVFHYNELPHANMIAVAKGHGIHLRSKSRSINNIDLNRFEHILAVDESTKQTLLNFFPTNDLKIELLMNYHELEFKDIPNPYGEKINRYKECFTLILQCVQELVKSLEKNYIN